MSTPGKGTVAVVGGVSDTGLRAWPQEHSPLQEAACNRLALLSGKSQAKGEFRIKLLVKESWEGLRFLSSHPAPASPRGGTLTCFSQTLVVIIWFFSS